MVACQETKTAKEESAATNDPKEEVAEKTCTYEYNEGSAEVMWVSYKYTEKTGVKGVFDSLEVTGIEAGSTPAEVFANAAVSIYTASVNSGDAERDPKIQNNFFGEMTDGEMLKGTVTAVSGDKESGSISFMVTMNGVEQSVEGTYSYEGGKLEAKAEIDINAWNANAALAELNNVCSELHKGSDGESVLWPDVTLFVSAEVTEKCD